MSEHHETLPISSWPAFLLCGQYKPDSTSTFDNRRGTAMHEYTISLLRGEKPAESDHMEFGDSDACEWSAGKVREICEKYGVAVNDLTFEQRLELYDDQGNLVTFGTSDISGGILIIDLKGAFDYDQDRHHHKPQLQGYSLARMRKEKLTRLHCAEIYMSPRQSAEYDVTHSECTAVAESVVRNVEMQTGPNPCDYCHLCAKRWTCEAIQQRVNAVAAYMGLPDLSKAIHEIEAPEDLAKLQFLAKQLESFAKEATSHVRRMAFEKDVEVPGYKKMEQAGKASIPCEKLDDAYNLTGLPNNLFQKCLSLTLGTLETEYAKYYGMSQKAGKEDLRQKLGHLIQKGQEKKFLKAVKSQKKAESF